MALSMQKKYTTRNQDFKEKIKTHDVAKLLEICLVFDGDFEKIRQPVIGLNPYSSKFRYPTEFEIPDQEDAELAIKQAESIVQFVIQKVSEPETGQKDIFSINR